MNSIGSRHVSSVNRRATQTAPSRARTPLPRGLSPKQPSPKTSGLHPPRGRTVLRAAHSPDNMPAIPQSIAHLNISLGGEARHEALRTMPTLHLYEAAKTLCMHPNPFMRRDVVAALLQRPSMEALPLLAVFAADLDPAVRHAVATCTWPEALPVLAHLSQDENEWVGHTATRSLGENPENGAVVTLAAVLQAGTAWHKHTALQALATINTPQAHAAISTVLHDESAWVRHAAVRAIVRCPSPNIDTTLADMVAHDATPWVRHAAMRTLMARNPALALHTLAQLPNPDHAVLQHLFDHQGAQLEGHTPPLVWFEETLSNPQASDLSRGVAKQTLQDHAVRMLLDETDRETEHGLSLFATLGMDAPLAETLQQQHHLPPPDFLPLIDSMSRHMDANVRAVAAKLMARFPHNAMTLPMLTALSQDADPRVRVAVAETLQDLTRKLDTPESYLPMMGHLLTDADEGVRNVTVYALDPRGSQQSHALQTLAADDPYPWVREGAVYSLHQNKSASAWSTIHRLAQDAHPAVRQAVAYALQDQDFVHAYDALTALAHDADPEVRGDVARTLVAFAMEPETPPTSVEAALHLLDRMATTPDDALPVIHECQSMLLSQALSTYEHDPAMQAMLLRWAHAMGTVDRHSAWEVASSQHPQSHAIMQAWLNSPSEQVRDVAHEVMQAVQENRPLDDQFETPL